MLPAFHAASEKAVSPKTPAILIFSLEHEQVLARRSAGLQTDVSLELYPSRAVDQCSAK